MSEKDSVKITKKTYVEFFYPGAFVSTTGSLEVTDRDGDFDIPKWAYAWRYYDKEKIVRNGKTYKSGRLNISGLVYPEGEVLSADDVRQYLPNNHILLCNMKTNGWRNVIRTPIGQFFPFEADDTVLCEVRIIGPVAQQDRACHN